MFSLNKAAVLVVAIGAVGIANAIIKNSKDSKKKSDATNLYDDELKSVMEGKREEAATKVKNFKLDDVKTMEEEERRRRKHSCTAEPSIEEIIAEVEQQAIKVRGTIDSVSKYIHSDDFAKTKTKLENSLKELEDSLKSACKKVETTSEVWGEEKSDETFGEVDSDWGSEDIEEDMDMDMDDELFNPDDSDSEEEQIKKSMEENADDVKTIED